MPCFYPRKVWRSREGRNKETGNWPVVFDIRQGYSDTELIVPCQKCIGCRLEHSRQFAARCMHESTLWDSNYFLTLTYAPEHLPPGGTLVKDDLQKFWKRLRKWIFTPYPLGDGRVPEYEEQITSTGRVRKIVTNGIRYFACGEYGGRLGRPHYHAIVFNLEIPDLQPYKEAPDGSMMYTSATLNSLWPYGFVVIGNVTFESCAYVARYVTKKISGPGAEEHYQGKVPEFVACSTVPGIGANWFLKYSGEVIQNGFVLVNGSKCSVPRFYLKLMDKKNHEEYLTFKNKRNKMANERKGNLENHPDRLEAREKLALLRASKLVRPIGMFDKAFKNPPDSETLS